MTVLILTDPGTIRIKRWKWLLEIEKYDTLVYIKQGDIRFVHYESSIPFKTDLRSVTSVLKKGDLTAADLSWSDQHKKIHDYPYYWSKISICALSALEQSQT